MSVRHNITLRAKFLFLGLGLIILSLIAALNLLHSENTLGKYRSLERQFDTYFSTLHQIDYLLMSFTTAGLRDSIFHDPESALTQFNQASEQLDEDLQLLMSIPFLQRDSLIVKEIRQIQSLNQELRQKVGRTISDIRAEPNDLINITSNHRYIDEVFLLKSSIHERIYQNSTAKQKQLKANNQIVIFISLLVMILSITAFALSIDRNIQKILSFIRVMERGGRPGDLNINSGDEFQDMSEHLNSFQDHRDAKILFLKTIGKGGEISSFVPEQDDLLGNELMVMAHRLNTVRQEENDRQEEERKRSWKTDGIAGFGEILRSERENVKELSFKIIQKLVSYLRVEMGTIMLTTMTPGDEQMLETIASYAYDRRKHISKTFAFGEGLPGTCALEKEKIYINEVPEYYSDVISGVGQSKPRFVLLVPLKIEEEIFGILELASFRDLQQHELDFVDEIAQSIASTLAGVKTNERTAELLKQSQEQAEKLLRQEEEMRINMKELQKAEEESRKKESEISGILNAMNESSLVAEYDMGGHFSKINDKFLLLLESPREQILGKNHHEFALVDKYGDNYKSFWKRLQEGEIIPIQEQFRLYSGKVVWLQQTYTPIYNNEGEIYKILNIAVDITQSKLQQEHLEKQASEIKRKSLELEGLNEAVNSSIIKCEIDHEGIILNLNSNYSTVTGFNRKELLGRNYRLFLKDIEKDQFEKIWLEVLKDKTYEGAIRRTKPTGEETWLMSTFSPVKDESGVIYKIYFLALDITEKRLKYQLLEEANKEVERLRLQLLKDEG